MPVPTEFSSSMVSERVKSPYGRPYLRMHSLLILSINPRCFLAVFTAWVSNLVKSESVITTTPLIIGLESLRPYNRVSIGEMSKFFKINSVRCNLVYPLRHLLARSKSPTFALSRTTKLKSPLVRVRTQLGK